MSDSAHAFKPYVVDETRMPELTIRALLLGALLGLAFGASSVYLGLRVGLTVSASIPIAVISITVLRALSGALGSREGHARGGLRDERRLTHHAVGAGRAGRAGWLRRCIATPETFYSIRVNAPDGKAYTVEVPDLKKLWDQSVVLRAEAPTRDGG